MKYMKTYLVFLQTNRCVMAKKGAAATNDHYISTIIVVNTIGDPCLRKFHCCPSFFAVSVWEIYLTRGIEHILAITLRKDGRS